MLTIAGQMAGPNCKKKNYKENQGVKYANIFFNILSEFAVVRG